MAFKMIGNPKLSARPVSGYKVIVKGDKKYLMLKGGGITYRSTKMEVTDDDIKSLDKMLASAVPSDGLTANNVEYRIFSNQLMATLVAAMHLTMEGVEYTVKYFKDLVVLVVGRSRIFFRPSKNMLIITKDLEHYLTDDLRDAVNVVVI